MAAIMVSKNVLMSWCFFAVLCGSLNADSNTTDAPPPAARDEFLNEELTWTCPMEYSTGFLAESEKWNDFIHSLYCNFSEFEIQGSETKYDLDDRTNFLKQLQSNDEVKSAYAISRLADELYSLEEHTKMLTENIDLHPFYQSLLKRISEHAHNFTDDPYLYKKALGFLYAATLSREHNFDDASESNIILNISYYLDSVKNNIVILKNLKNSNTKEDAMNEHKEDNWEIDYKFQLAIDVMNKYKEDEWKINEKFKEVIDIILNEIIPEIDNIANQTNSQIELLLDDVIYLQKEVNETHEELYQKKEELGNLLMLQNSNTVLNMFGSVIGFVGEIGATAFSIIETGSTVSETLSFNTPGSVRDAAKQSIAHLELLKDKIKLIRDQRLGYLKRSLKSISQETSKYPVTFSDISDKMSNFESRLNKISGEKIASYDFNEIQNVEIELKATLQEKRVTFSSQYNITDQQMENELVAIQNMQKVFHLSLVVLDTCNAHSSNEAKNDIMHKVIKQNERNFYKLKQYEDKIYNTIVPMLQNIQNDIDCIVSNTAKKSNVILDIVKWNVQSTLKYAIAQMQQLTLEFKVLDKVKYFIENMIETAVILINAYDHVQDFEKEQAIANFIVDIKSSAVSSTSHNTVLESYLNHTLNDLKMMLSSSIIVQQYKKAFDAFNHFIFPFADIYLDDVVAPTHLVLDPKKVRNMLENLANKTETGIRNINSNVKYIEESHSFCTGSGEFSSRYRSTKPFFVWKNAEHRQMISKLLSGESVTVKADITHSPFYMDAIKFNVIEFRFKAKHERNQLQIDNATYGFQLSATHLGNSYYRYNNKIYLMTTPAICFRYVLEEGDDFQRNAVYDKIKNGEFLLSPYASWKLKLDDRYGKSFSSLKRFKNEIDLELGGNGQYIPKDTGDCSNLNVNQYYKSVDKYSEN